MSNTFTSVANPADLKYQMDRRRQIEELLPMSPAQLDRQLRYLLQTEPIRDDHHVTKSIMREMYNAPYIPQNVKSILDSTGTTTGNVLIRQDLEPVLYALFVKTFPAFDRLAKGPSNGLVHAATQITSPDTGSLGSTIITEIGTVNYTAGAYNRATFPIAVFATGRGVSIKEIAAVAQGGSPYDPNKTEMSNGMIKLATDVQYTILQGNATNSSGQSATTEGGAYNANAFDGFRGVTGSVGAFSGNSATQADIASLNMLESIQFTAAKGANNGGRPSAVFMSMNSKQALDSEQQTNVRYNNNLVDIIPGVKTNGISYANGELAIIPIPGNTMGSYNRTSDSALVEDIYVVDESALTVRWLYSESFTILQIPSGVDGVLSERWIVFGMYGLEIAAPLFMGKVRRLAN